MAVGGLVIKSLSSSHDGVRWARKERCSGYIPTSTIAEGRLEICIISVHCSPFLLDSVRSTPTPRLPDPR